MVGLHGNGRFDGGDGKVSNLLQLNDRLFRELDRLEAAEGDELDDEIERARAIGQMSRTIIDNANTMMRAVQLKQQASMDVAEAIAVPTMLLGDGRVEAEVMR